MRLTALQRLAGVTSAFAFAICLSSGLAVAENARPGSPRQTTTKTAAEIQQQQAKMKAEFQRKQADIKRKHEAMAKSLQPGQDRLRQQASRYLQSHERTPPPPFNRSVAPSPDECLRAFVNAAKNANSMEQLLTFLPHNEMQSLKAQQSQYDPAEAARGREWHRKQNSKLTDEDLTHLSNPPYTNALKFKKSLAGDIRDILSVKEDGDKASLVVSTNNGATINGEYYPYGQADVEMIGEGNTWKLSRFRPSIMVFKEPPEAPK